MLGYPVMNKNTTRFLIKLHPCGEVTYRCVSANNQVDFIDESFLYKCKVF